MTIFLDIYICNAQISFIGENTNIENISLNAGIVSNAIMSVVNHGIRSVTSSLKCVSTCEISHATTFHQFQKWRKVVESWDLAQVETHL